jgi:hypothetical protein
MSCKIFFISIERVFHERCQNVLTFVDMKQYTAVGFGYTKGYLYYNDNEAKAATGLRTKICRKIFRAYCGNDLANAGGNTGAVRERQEDAE